MQRILILRHHVKRIPAKNNLRIREVVSAGDAWVDDRMMMNLVKVFSSEINFDESERFSIFSTSSEIKVVTSFSWDTLYIRKKNHLLLFSKIFLNNLSTSLFTFLLYPPSSVGGPQIAYAIFFFKYSCWLNS